jgi:hypothetical protein
MTRAPVCSFSNFCRGAYPLPSKCADRSVNLRFFCVCVFINPYHIYIRDLMIALTFKHIEWLVEKFLFVFLWVVTSVGGGGGDYYIIWMMV